MRVSRGLFVLLAFVVAFAFAPARADAAADPLERARLLHRFAAELVEDPAIESRQRCLRDLEQAIELDPDGRAGNHWLLMGRLREGGRRDREARQCYRNACAQAPRDPETWLGLARVLRREWLRTLDGPALRAAAAVLDTAAQVRPASSAVWIALCPLRYELKDMAGAAEAAERALRGYPRVPEAALAAALMAWRTGNLERADSLFRVTLPRLEPDLRAMFEHPGRFTGRAPKRPPGLLTSGDDDAADSLHQGPRGPWVDDPARDALPDPDPTTPENELLLEYRARVAHAYLLFNDASRPGLDARAETYIRYGPPARVQINPPGLPLFFKPNANSGGPNASLAEYPLDAQVWSYPDLGMSILLHDRTLLGHYSTPALREPWPNSSPSPEALAHRGDLLATGGGFAVFPTLAPSAQRLEVTATVAAFEGVTQPRLTAFVQAVGDSLEARWVVSDARGRVVARERHAMGPSVCGATRRADALSIELPPGRYEVAVSARDAHGRRGLDRDTLTLARVIDALSMSDIVPCCAEPALLVDRDAIRLEPLGGRIVRGNAPLTAYFEIYHLEAGPDGLCRYTFDYAIQRLAVDKKGRPTAEPTTTTWASREEQFKGRLRRQFLSVPVSALGAGHYRLIVSVHDALAGTSDSGAFEFERP